MTDTPQCPYCGAASRLVTGATIYPHRPDLGGSAAMAASGLPEWVRERLAEKYRKEAAL